MSDSILSRCFLASVLSFSNKLRNSADLSSSTMRSASAVSNSSIMSRVWVSRCGVLSSAASDVSRGPPRSMPGRPLCPFSGSCANVAASPASLLRRAKLRSPSDMPAMGSDVSRSRRRIPASSSSAKVSGVYPSLLDVSGAGNAGVGDVGVGGVGAPCGSLTASPPRAARRALRPMVMSMIRLASAPTPAP